MTKQTETPTFAAGSFVRNTVSGKIYRVLEFQPEAGRRLSLVRYETLRIGDRQPILRMSIKFKFAVVKLTSLEAFDASGYTLLQ